MSVGAFRRRGWATTSGRHVALHRRYSQHPPVRRRDAESDDMPGQILGQPRVKAQVADYTRTSSPQFMVRLCPSVQHVQSVSLTVKTFCRIALERREAEMSAGLTRGRRLTEFARHSPLRFLQRSGGSPPFRVRRGSPSGQPGKGPPRWKGRDRGLAQRLKAWRSLHSGPDAICRASLANVVAREGSRLPTRTAVRASDTRYGHRSGQTHVRPPAPRAATASREGGGDRRRRVRRQHHVEEERAAGSVGRGWKSSKPVGRTRPAYGGISSGRRPAAGGARNR